MRVVERLPVFPPKTLSDWIRLTPMISRNSIQLLPYMNQTVYDRLKKYNLHQNRLFQIFLNGELMDSVQTSVERCPAFLGFTALQTFHKGAFAVHGGLASVAEQLSKYIKESGNEIFLRHPIHVVEKKGSGYYLHSKRNKVFESDYVILNNSVHNLHDTLSEELRSQSYIKPEKEKSKRSMGSIHHSCGGSRRRV